MVDKPKQIATMVLKVDLQCWRCYKKIKKLLCKFPQIQDQVYDEKQNTVTVKVVCCCPEKIMRKIICKGGDSIKSFEVKVSDQKPSPTKETPDQKKPDQKPSSNGKSNGSPAKPKPDEPEKKKPNTRVRTKGDQPENFPPPRGPEPAPTPVPVYQPPADPIRTCCRECYEGRGGGPCVYGYGGLPPCYQYDGYLGRPIYDSYSGGRGSCYLICEEDSRQLCRIM